MIAAAALLLLLMFGLAGAVQIFRALSEQEWE
jgi:hypothetical protein